MRRDDAKRRSDSTHFSAFFIYGHGGARGGYFSLSARLCYPALLPAFCDVVGGVCCINLVSGRTLSPPAYRGRYVKLDAEENSNRVEE